MSQRIYNLSLLDKFKCEMHKLLYKEVESSNTTYIHHYLDAMLGHIPELVKEYMLDHNLQVDSQSLSSLDDIIVRTIQRQCVQNKSAKELKHY
jgi:hypothetical protein